MDNAIYANLTRMKGLETEMQAIANNIANVSTGGFKREGVIFSEWIAPTEARDYSLSMANAEIRRVDLSQGALTQTNAPLDFAIEGPGFFQVENAGGRALTRAGNFQTNANGELVMPTGNRVLDAGGAPILIPQGATQITLGPDGSLSADGQLVTIMGLVEPAEGDAPVRQGDNLFTVANPTVPVEAPRILQGFQEDSNVDAILEVARMIEVQRSYERAADIGKTEDERIRTVLRTLTSQ